MKVATHGPRREVTKETSATPLPISAADVAEHLVRHAQSVPDQRCYVLADPTLRDCREALQARFGELGVPGSLSVTKLRLAPGRLDTSHWPLLIELSPIRSTDSALLSLICEMALQDWQPASLRRGQGHRIAGWLFSTAPANELASHLAKAFIQSRPPARKTLIRFHDPSVLGLAWDDMAPHQRASFLGPVCVWLALAHDGRLAAYTVTADGARDIGAAEPVVFPGNNSGQWTRLDQIGPLNRAWLRLAQAGVPPDADTMRRARHTLLRADSYGFRDPEDLVEFAWRALGTSVTFDQHSRIQQCIRVGAAGDSFGSLTASLTETDWHVIGMESNQETGA